MKKSIKTRIMQALCAALAAALLLTPAGALAAQKNAQRFMGKIDKDWEVYLSAENNLTGYAVQSERVAAIGDQLALRKELLADITAKYKMGLASQSDADKAQAAIEKLEADLNKATMNREKYALALSELYDAKLEKYDLADIFFVCDPTDIDAGELADAVVWHQSRLSIYEQQQEWIEKHAYTAKAESSFSMEAMIVPAPLDPKEGDDGEVMPDFEPKIDEDKLRLKTKDAVLDLGILYEDIISCTADFKRLIAEQTEAESGYKTGKVSEGELKEIKCSLYAMRESTYIAIGKYTDDMYELNNSAGGWLSLKFSKLASEYKALSKQLEEDIVDG